MVYIEQVVLYQDGCWVVETLDSNDNIYILSINSKNSQIEIDESITF